MIMELLVTVTRYGSIGGQNHENYTEASLDLRYGRDLISLARGRGYGADEARRNLAHSGTELLAQITKVLADNTTESFT